MTPAKLVIPSRLPSMSREFNAVRAAPALPAVQTFESGDRLGVVMSPFAKWFFRHGHIAVSAVLHLIILLILALWMIPRPVHHESVALEAFEAVPEAVPESFGNVLDGLPLVETVGDQMIQVPTLANPLAGGGEGAPDPAALAVAGVGSGNGQGGGDGNGIGTGKEPGINFFGTAAEGTKFIYIVDSSGSMEEPARGERGVTRWTRAISELNKSLSKLKPHQSFYIYFFSDETVRLYETDPRRTGRMGIAARGLQPATTATKSKAQKWIRTILPGGMTNPEMALQHALSLQPDAIFLLTDGEFEDADELMARINKHNIHKVVIHTIAFDNDAGGGVLQEIAKQNGGTYRFVR